MLSKARIKSRELIENESLNEQNKYEVNNNINNNFNNIIII